MNLTEKTINSQTKYDGKIIKLNVDEVQLPDGTKSYREYVRHSGGAAVLFVKDGKVLLVRQFRYAYGKSIYEIPAGKIDSGEEPLCAAARELEEETGDCPKLVHMIDLYPSPGYTDEVIHIYKAVSAEFAKQNLDDGEFLNTEFIGIEEVMEMIDKGEINDAKTVAAIYKYLAEK